MSFGSYQPFNPTANNQGNIGSEFGRAVGGIVTDKLFGQDAQGPLSGLTRGLPGALINNVVKPAADRMTSGQNLEGIGQGIFNDNLPGAPRLGGGPAPLPGQPPSPYQVDAGMPGGKSGNMMPGSMFGGGKSFSMPPVNPQKAMPGADMYSSPMKARPGFQPDYQ